MEMQLARSEISDRYRGTTLVLAVLLGVFGAHRFYTGKTLSGALMLCSLGGLGIWWLYDVIVIATGGFRDAEDRPIARWWESDAFSGVAGGIPSQQLEAVLEELETMRSEVGELGERVDFMERVLSRVKHEALPPGEQ